jgi:2-(3-amino-3-carboxypropyl)histidine synthase
MKTLFIEAKYEGKVNLTKIKVDSLPKKIGLITTVQFVDYLDKIKAYLDSYGKKVLVGKGKQKYPGQILGCDAKSPIEIQNKVDAFLYIGTGRFHPLIVGVRTKKPVFTFNPISGKQNKLENKEIENYKKRKKAAFVKFLSSDTIGIIVSTKPGQHNIKQLTSLEKKYPKKEFYTFVTETLDYKQLENFPFIEAWVNTACPRIEEDIKIVNIEDL